MSWPGINLLPPGAFFQPGCTGSVCSPCCRACARRKVLTVGKATRNLRQNSRSESFGARRPPVPPVPYGRTLAQHRFRPAVRHRLAAAFHSADNEGLSPPWGRVLFCCRCAKQFQDMGTKGGRCHPSLSGARAVEAGARGKSRFWTLNPRALSFIGRET